MRWSVARLGLACAWILAGATTGEARALEPQTTEEAIAPPGRIGPGQRSVDATARESGPAEEGVAPSRALLDALPSPGLRALASEVLERNPDIARAARRAAAAEARAPQARSLPDPVAGLTLFALPPETRSGPQRLSASIQQRFPWFGKRSLREKAALYEALAAQADVETLRLDRLTAARRLGHELTFLDAQEALARAERSTLVRYERTAQARYAAGTGLQQEIVRIQAEITRTDTRLLTIAERRATLRAELNRLRDRPAGARIPPGPPIAHGPGKSGVDAALDGATLREAARAHRPELAAAAARIAAAETRIELARMQARPDITIGLSHTVVERRRDALGRRNPPEDNGDDVVSLSGAVSLPVWRQKLAAGVQEAEAGRWEAEEARRSILAELESRIGDLAARLPLLTQHLSLLETVLVKQAREALRSAETAYSTGKLNAVDLLDAEIVLFEVQIAAARTRTDLAVARAELERAIGHPLTALEETTHD